MREESPEEAAKDFIRRWFDSIAEGHPDELTAPYLAELHGLTAEEAEEYRQFCKAHTITFRGCYGDGSIMWPKWVAHKADIASL